MPNYKKNVPTLTLTQWQPDAQIDGVELASSHTDCQVGVLRTASGDHRVDPGDWVDAAAGVVVTDTALAESYEEIEQNG